MYRHRDRGIILVIFLKNMPELEKSVCKNGEYPRNALGWYGHQ